MSIYGGREMVTAGCSTSGLLELGLGVRGEVSSSSSSCDSSLGYSSHRAVRCSARTHFSNETQLL